MDAAQQAFFDRAIAQGVLRLGDFTLKSGRRSPYFFNAGLFNTGAALAHLGRAYADTIRRAGVDYDTLFGPAYKGIPLVTATAMALAEHHGRDAPWCFNRKEAKDHGEGGLTVGASLQGRILIVDDVITAGTAIGEALQLIGTHRATAVGVVLALDRQERGQGSLSAVQEVQQQYGIPVYSVATLTDLIAYLSVRPEYAAHVGIMRAYQAQYGVQAGA